MIGSANQNVHPVPRKTKYLVPAVLFVTVFFPIVSSAQESGKFEEANESYRGGDYGKAAALYEQLAGEDPRTADYHYNLGNAYVRLGKLSEAVLSFEKALLLAPRDPDIRHNLDYARGRLEYQVEDNRNWYLKAADSALSRFTQHEMNFLLLVFIFIFLLSSILFFVFKQTVFWTAPRKFIFAFVLLAALAAGFKYAQLNMIRPAIVMANECEARYGPSTRNQVAFHVGGGIKGFILDRREDWSRVLLMNGESGWIMNEDMAEIRV
ncbi:MAG: Tetratricopeptide repeat protein [Candidatus Omnitrophica bacterium ADurb.Bin277]|nr:MAG: Tetratricopeptide repeat protein [Candidatus Omnitrophica bacterium ADurb.Bin277]